MKLSFKARAWLFFILTVLPGSLGVVVFGYYALVDWAALQTAYAHFEQLARSDADLRALFVAEAQQNLHRLNLFADGVWALLSALLVAVGLHGLCSNRAEKGISANSGTFE